MNKQDLVQKSYDELPYFSKPFAKTQPGLQASILQLLGHKTPDIQTARVLEIGCSFGGNIIPFALAYPNAEVLGIDLSEVQIEKGRHIIQKLGLKNINLVKKNILDFEESNGKFDYIICHGVYSWVPSEVQEAILKLIHNHLAPNGSAVVSYNTYPGWKTQDIFRELMKLRVHSMSVSGFSLSPTDAVHAAKDALSLLTESPFCNETMKHSAEAIFEKDNHYIYHEYLETYNSPCLLYEFQDKLSKYELSHIIDSDLSRSLLHLNNKTLENKVQEFSGSNHILREQYYDFISNRMFRSSIITHTKNLEHCNTTTGINISELQKLYIRGSFSKNKEGELLISNEHINETYEAILENLNNLYPEMISIRELYELHKEDSHFFEKILHLIHKSVVEFSIEKREVIKQKKLSIHPSYLNYIRYFLEEKNPVIYFSNSCGFKIELSEVELTLLQLFDGTKTDEEVESEILRLEQQGVLTIPNQEELAKKALIKNTVANYRAFIEKNFLNYPDR